MKAVVFGASGRTGVELINQALGKGHNVVAFVRNPAKFQVHHKNLSVAGGNALNKEQVENAVNGCDGVHCFYDLPYSFRETFVTFSLK